MNSSIQPTHPNPKEYPGFLIWLVSNKWEKYVNKVLSVHNLNHGEVLHLISLKTLLLESKEVTQSNLAQYTETTTMGVSKILNSLEKLGYIARIQGTDSRSKSVSITPSGDTILIATAQLLNNANSAFFRANPSTNFIQQLTKLQ
jgi:DNA-binding MarR family transcriptional regulator